MNKKELLQMTFKEIEEFFNINISNITFESEDDSEVKGKMIDEVKVLFDDTVNVSIPYYTNREFVIYINSIRISFKVQSKKTGKTVRVSKLREKEVKNVGKFKFDDIRISFYNPYFKEDDLDKYVVKVSENYSSGGAEISLKHSKEKIIEMLTKDILLEEIQKQDKSWQDIRKTVILNAAQPIIHTEYLKRNFNQDRWDTILLKTEEVNKSLIDDEIEKIFNVLG